MKPKKFEELGIAVSKIRTGIVLAKEGALAKMAGPIRLGLGAVFWIRKAISKLDTYQ